jgi:hypothetical protein
MPSAYCAGGDGDGDGRDFCEWSDIFSVWQRSVQLHSSLQRDHYHWLQMQHDENGKLIENIC